MSNKQDQAQKLRDLVQQVSAEHTAKQRSPDVVAIVECCPEVGTAEIADRLGAELSAKSILVEIRSSEDLLHGPQQSDRISLANGETAGSHESNLSWEKARMVIFAVTSVREVILETYGALKMAKLHNPDLPAFLLPIQCRDGLEAQMVHRRFTSSCERFLGFSVPIAPWLKQSTTGQTEITAEARILELARFVQEHCLAHAASAMPAA